MEYGLLPGAGGSVRLPRALPAALARRLLYTGEIIDGDTAAALGAGRVERAPGGAGAHRRRDRRPAAAAQPDGAAQRQAAGGRGLGSWRHRAALDNELDVAVGYIGGHADAREGLAAFREKRSPRFGAEVLR